MHELPRICPSSNRRVFAQIAMGIIMLYRDEEIGSMRGYEGLGQYRAFVT